MRARSRRAFLLSAGALLAAPHARSQAVFPPKPMRIVVGFPPGGASDTAARLIGEHMARLAGQPVIVENRIGAGGTLAAAAVARAAPDGCTLLLTGRDTVIGMQGLRTLPYDPNRDFAFITPVMSGSVLLCVHRSVPAASLRELIEHARGNPGLPIGSWAQGSQGHFIVEALNRQYGVKLTHVAYKGEGPMAQDLIGGQIAGGTGTPVSLIGAVRSRHLRPIATTSGARGQRSAALPEVPTFAEQGLDHPPVTLSGWLGMLTTAGTPRSSIALLNQWVRAALEQPEIRAKIETYGLEVTASTAEEFEASFHAEVRNWLKMVNDFGVKLD